MCFAAQRYDEGGQECPDFVLNQAPYRQAQILIALDNFGCGSSREHAHGLCWISGPLRHRTQFR